MAPPIRIGVLLPQGNLTCEQEFPVIGAGLASFHYQRLARQGTAMSAASLLTLLEQVEPAAGMLALLRPRAYVLACTSGTFLQGAQAHDAAGQRLRTATGVPAITTASALLQACRALASRRVFMLTPYPPAITAEEVDFLAAHEVDATRCLSLGCTDGEEIRQLTAARVYRALTGARRQLRGADAVFLSCTNMPTWPFLARAEAQLGVPVFSSNSVTAWAGLRLAGVGARLPGLGRLGALALPDAALYA